LLFGNRKPASLTFEEIKKIVQELVCLIDQLSTYDNFGKTLSQNYTQLVENNGLSYDILISCIKKQKDQKNDSWNKRALCSMIDQKKKKIIENINSNMRIDEKVLSELKTTEDVYHLGLKQVSENFNTLGKKEAFKYFFNLDFDTQLINNKTNDEQNFEETETDRDMIEAFRRIHFAILLYVDKGINEYSKIFSATQELQQICQEIATTIKIEYGKIKKPIPDEIQDIINYVYRDLPSRQDLEKLEKWVMKSQIDITRLVRIINVDEVAQYLKEVTKYTSEIHALHNQLQTKKKLLEKAQATFT
jgi:hypothetical protein